LEPAWLAHQERGLLATLRVRLDNGFVLRDMPASVPLLPLCRGLPFRGAVVPCPRSTVPARPRRWCLRHPTVVPA
ncbi:hypothetical protein ABT129_35960, partial [Streptomyces sp. NPDC002057]